MKLIPAKAIALPLFAIAFSIYAQTPIISYNFETGAAANGGSLGSTYDGTIGIDVVLGSASSFSVAPTAGAYSYVDPGTLALTANYSLTGLGTTVAGFTGTANTTDVNNELRVNNTAGQTTLLAGDMGVTMAGWFYDTTTAVNQQAFWIDRAGGGTRWVMSPQTTGSVNDQLRIGSSTRNSITSAGSFSAGVWTFIAIEVIYNNPTGDDTMNVYINGTLITSYSAGNVYADAAATSGFVNEVSANGITFGAAANNGSGAYNGYMDNLQIYNTALTASQIATLYDSYLSPVPEPGTCALLGTGLAGLLVAIRRRK